MSSGRTDVFARLAEEGDRLLRNAQTAAQNNAEGTDASGAVTATLDEQGRVVDVRIGADWRRQVDGEDLSAAVLESVRDALQRRLDAWAQAYAEPEPGPAAAAANAVDRRTATRATVERIGFDPQDVQRRLHEAANGPMSESDRLAALTGLLDLVEAIEQGLDEVSGRMQAVLEATHTGRSPHREATVTVTGGGLLTEVRLDQRWLRQAHEANIGRQVTAALRDAYKTAAAHGVDKLIADSPLGRARDAMQDPLGLARRLGLTRTGPPGADGDENGGRTR